MAEHDDNWLEALAGARASADEQERREHAALRRAARALEDGAVDELAERRLLQRLEREGLLPQKHVRQRLGLRHVARAAVVLLCLGLALEWFVFLPPATGPATRQPLSRPAAQKAAAEADAAPAPPEPAVPRAGQAPEPAPEALSALPEREAQQELPALMEDRVAPAEASRRTRNAPEMRGFDAGPPAKDEAPAKIEVRVEDREIALEELRGLLEEPGIRRLDQAGGVAGADSSDLQLVCDTAAACARLNDWLEAHRAGRAFVPGRALHLQLRAR